MDSTTEGVMLTSHARAIYSIQSWNSPPAKIAPPYLTVIRQPTASSPLQSPFSLVIDGCGLQDESQYTTLLCWVILKAKSFW